SGSSNANGTSTTGSGLSRILDQDLSRVPPSTTIDTRDVNRGVPADPNANGRSATGGGVVVIGPRDQVRESGRDATSRPQTPAPEADKALPLTSGRLLAHPVKAGDTLIAIARRYYGDESVVERLAAYNKNRVGPRNSLRVGVTLRIPPRDVLMGRARLADDASPSVIPSGSRRAENSPTNTARETATGRTTPSSTSTASATTYTVKAGDTLGTIARATLGTSKRWREIFDANRTTLSDEDSLKVGMKLKIPAR
ncbi:MAG: LysM peptidoglycan-binding domain-containing protein, partial [Planctomyces sp.]